MSIGSLSVFSITSTTGAGESTKITIRKQHCAMTDTVIINDDIIVNI